MNEARKLDTNNPSDVEPKAATVNQPQAIEADLSPLILEQNASLTGESKPLEAKAPKRKRKHSKAQEQAPRAPFLDRISNAMMVLFLSGLFSFLLGTAVAAAVVMGLLDLQTGWVKDLLKTVKELAKSAGGAGGIGTPEP